MVSCPQCKNHNMREEQKRFRPSGMSPLEDDKIMRRYVCMVCGYTGPWNKNSYF